VSGPPPAVAGVRVAVRRCLADLNDSGLVLVACSGGPDSVALAAATAFVAPRRGLRAGLLTVDHGLQRGSGARAAMVADWGRSLGLDPVEVLAVKVSGPGGPEAAARTARYAALDAAARRLDAAAVLLGHTRDDQAETVLLGLARGSGARAAAGMPGRRGGYRRPLLELPRSMVAQAAAGQPVWHDPHNGDPAYARSRVRAVLPVLAEAAGPGLVAGLARTARLLRDDADALDALAAGRLAALVAADGTLPVAELALEPPAIRRRVLHRWALAAGSPAGALGAVHLAAVDELIIHWRGQRSAALPGGLLVGRSRGVLRITAADGSDPGRHDTVNP
jgi:tRNA(Ile)-lysidine synthase